MSSASRRGEELLARGGEVLALLQHLVRCPSTQPGASTNDAFSVLLDFLQQEGIDAEIVSCGPSTPPLARATISGAQPGPHVLFQGHIDVVPAGGGWDHDPFEPLVTDGFVHGRGSVDMKGGLAAFASAMRALTRRGLPRGTVTLLVDSDEETGSDQGLIPYLGAQKEIGYDAAICGEPTALRPYLGNRGLIWASIVVEGKASHAGMPHAGRNPIPLIARILDNLPAPAALEAPYGACPPSLTPTMLHAGTSVNSIPASATLMIDRRLVPGEDADEVVARLVESVHEAAEGSDLHSRLELVKSWPPCALREDSVLARTTQAIVSRRGHNATFGFDDASNDASFLSAAGVPTLIWGPGEPCLAHAANERVEFREVEAAAAMYEEAVLALLAEDSALG